MKASHIATPAETGIQKSANARAATNASSHVKTASEILASNSLLQTIYLLRDDVRGVDIVPTEESAARFLLWAAVYGRKEYQELIIDRDFFEFITQPVQDYLSRLELFAAQVSGQLLKLNDMSKMHFWYYVLAVKDLNLEIFVTGRELQSLNSIVTKPDSSNCGNSCLDTIIHALNSQRSALFNIGEPTGHEAFKRWSISNSEGMPPIPWLQVPASISGPHSSGVNLIGYAEGVLGIGEDLRAVAAMLHRCNIPFGIYNVGLSDAHATIQTSEWRTHFVDRPLFSINIFCMTAFETARLRVERGANLFVNRYNIGLWPWELTSLPEYWRHVFDLVDEVWAISPFLYDVYRALTEKPVILMPQYVNVTSVVPFDFSELEIDPHDHFIFLTMFDFNSYTARKNPKGTIACFQNAFPRKTGRERLVIKTINGAFHEKRLDELIKSIGNDPRIVLLDGPLTRAETCGLIQDAHCFVSLHRSEGFGRVIAEAMYLGTPVISTDWSGSKALVDELTGFPVAYHLRGIEPGEYTFEDGSQWAEPDLNVASQTFLTVRRQKGVVADRVARAKQKIRQLHGAENVSKAILERLSVLSVSIR